MANKDIRTDLVTNASDPLAGTRHELGPSALEAAGRSTFSSLVGEGGYDSLNEAGRQAFRALSQVPQDDERYPGARQAALDAVRDHKAAGLFDPQARSQTKEIAESKDPAVRNQAPTGTKDESAGPVNSVATATAATPDPNSTTPAVKGQSKP